jgi:hypothetical protein
MQKVGVPAELHLEPHASRRQELPAERARPARARPTYDPAFASAVFRSEEPRAPKRVACCRRSWASSTSDHRTSNRSGRISEGGNLREGLGAVVLPASRFILYTAWRESSDREDATEGRRDL